MPKKYFGEEEESEDDIDIYTKNIRELLLEDDELSPMEEAFMAGYDEAI